MEFTFNEYIKNPMGRKNSVFSQREMFRNLYKQKLDNILARELGKVDYKLFIYKDKYIAYFKIPSEVVPKFYYDVVVEFYPGDNTIKMDGNLENYNVKFFSNDPSFVYTFAYAFNKHDLIFKDMDSKLPKIALKTSAKEKNPENQIGYVKSLFFTYLLMRQYGLFSKSKFETYAKSYDKKALLKEIEDADIKIGKRQEEGSKIKKGIKFVDKDKKSRSIQQKPQMSSDTMKVVNNTKNVKNTKTTNRIGSVKKTKRI